jgi:endonuclease YncB( thermonuclease family)
MRGRARMRPRALDLIALAGSQSIRSPNRSQTTTGTLSSFRKNMIRVLLLTVMVTLATLVEANEITGPATPVDTTVIAINGQRIMLFGVDSVMRKQTCTISGKIWQCWPAALRNLEILLDQGPVTCETVGEPDVYGRLLARCNVNGKSLNEQLVRGGWAVARPSETTDYVAAEAEAKEKKHGLWQGEFMMPDAFRRAAGIFVERP